MLEIRGFSELQLIDQLRECVDVSESIDSVNENYYAALREYLDYLEEWRI